jgi:hypothetical protein
MSSADGAAAGPSDATADAASDGLPPEITPDAAIDAGDGSNPSNADASTDDGPLGDGRPLVIGHDAVPDALGNGPD